MASISLTDARAARTLWREIVALLHVDAGRERFSALLERARALPPKIADREDLIHCIELALTVKERLELHLQRERGLLAVLETAQDLTAITDPDRILQAIVQRARKLLGCDISYLSIHDPQQHAFYVRATDGAFAENFKRVRVAPDVGICGFVARNKVPYASADYRSDSRFPHTVPIDSAVTEENITSILGVPLLSGDAVTGVLFVGDRFVRSYTPWEKHILSVLAAHASVALNNARLFEQAQEALRQASDINQQLAQRTADTDQAAQAHERLTALAARGGSLTEICQMAAGILGGRVTAYDSGEREIAAAGNPPSPQDGGLPPLSPQTDDALHRAMHESRMQGRSVLLSGPHAGCCRVATATGGLGILGGLAIHTAAPLRDAEVRTFERSAMLASVVLLSRAQRESIRQDEMSALIRTLTGIPPGAADQVGAQAIRCGLDLSRPLQLILLTDLAEKADYLLRQLVISCDPAKLVMDAAGETLTILANSETIAAHLPHLRAQVEKILRQPASGVISAPIPQYDTLRVAYHRLTQCLQIVKTLAQPQRLYREQDLSLYTLVLAPGHGRDHAIAYLQTTLDALYDPQDARKCRLAHTLLAYLDAGHNAGAAALALGIHLNTVHQRLSTLDRLLDDWRNPARALDLHIALRLWSLDENWAA